MRNNQCARKPLQSRRNGISLGSTPRPILLNHKDPYQSMGWVAVHFILECAAVAKAVICKSPAEAITLSAEAAVLPAGHFSERFGGNKPLAVQCPSIQDHPAELRNIFSGREQAAGRHGIPAKLVVEWISQLVNWHFYHILG